MRFAPLALALLTSATPAQNNFTARAIPVSVNRQMMGPALTPDGTIGYVCDQGAVPNVIWELDVNAASVIRSLGSGSLGTPSGCAVVEGRLYVQDASQVVILDRPSGNVLGTIPTPLGRGSMVGEVLYRPLVQRAYAVIGNGIAVQVIDTTSDRLILNLLHGRFDTPGLGVDAIGQFGYLADLGGRLRILDLVNGTPVGTVSYLGTGTIGPYATQVTVDLLRNLVFVGYVDGNSRGAIAELSGGTLLTRTIPLGTFTNGLALTPNLKYLVTGDGTVADALHGTVVGTIPGGGNGEYRGAAASLHADRVLFSNFNSAFATLFEGLATFLTPTSPARVGMSAGYRLAVPGDGGLVYCAAASFGTTPGLPLPDGRVLPLQVDGLFLVSACANNAFFSGFIGVLDPNGVAGFAVNLPNFGGLAGIAYSVAAVTTDVNAPGGLSIVSNAVTQTIAP